MHIFKKKIFLITAALLLAALTACAAPSGTGERDPMTIPPAESIEPAESVSPPAADKESPLPGRTLTGDELNAEKRGKLQTDLCGSADGQLWFKADDSGALLDGDSDMLLLSADGTGTLWVTVGDGGADNIEFTYTIDSDLHMHITQTNTAPYGSVLPDEWKDVTVDFAGNGAVLIIRLSNGSDVKYHN